MLFRSPATRESFQRIGAEALESTPEEFARVLRTETEKWTKVVRTANVKVE